MRRGVWIILLLLCASSQGALAAEEHLTEQQKLGWRLFETSCGVCHTRPTLTSGMYGPELSKETAGGRQDVIQGVIADGTPRMPGFKYTYNPDHIAALAAYVLTLPPGNQAFIVPPPPRPAPTVQQ